MMTKNRAIKKMVEFYEEFKECEGDVQKAMYRTAIESFLWMLGNTQCCYLEKILLAGGREKDEPFIDYMEAFMKEENLNVFCLDYTEVEK